MSTPTQRIEVFRDTQDWINKDSDLSASIPIAKKKTIVFYDGYGFVIMVKGMAKLVNRLVLENKGTG